MKRFYSVFTTLCILVCAIPFVGMIFRPTMTSTDNRSMAELPVIRDEDGSVNPNFFSGLEAYFNDHFAFRNELIYLDAKIQSDVFKVSNVDGVIVGKDGWLFYSSTLKDFLGTENLSERELYSLLHNINLVNEYLTAKGIDFLVTVPPNKNSLYGEFMPYYNSVVVEPVHNMDKIAPLFNQNKIPYADLFDLFRSESEVLYLKQDSHWNMKGAVLAYNRIMDALELDHDDYLDVDVVRTVDEIGDLNKMLYTFYGDKEANYKYDIPENFEYLGDFGSVEDGRIETASDGGDRSLLMYRDSFGNTLVPIIANQFSHAWFSREAMYNLESHIEAYNPEIVIFEKVERNISEYLTMPPIISGIATDITDDVEDDIRNCTITMKSLDANFNYYEIRFELSKDSVDVESDFVVSVNGFEYVPYYTSESGGVLYLKKDNVSFPVEISIIKRDDNYTRLGSISFGNEDVE